MENHSSLDIYLKRWLEYSLLKKVYCFACKIFNKTTITSLINGIKCDSLDLLNLEEAVNEFKTFYKRKGFFFNLVLLSFLFKFILKKIVVKQIN